MTNSPVYASVVSGFRCATAPGGLSARGVVAAGVLVLGLAGGVWAQGTQTILLSPTRDTTIYESPASASNGRGIYAFSGETNSAGERRMLIGFPIAENIPAGSTVSSVSLILNLSRTSSPPGPGNLHRMLAAWGEGTSNAGSPGGNGAAATAGDATWTHRVWPDTLWTDGRGQVTTGGSFAFRASATTTVTTIVGPQTWESTPGLVEDVQAWVDDPASNFGWILICPTSLSSSARRFDTRHISTVSRRPLLVVEFTPPAVCAAEYNGDGVLNTDDLSDYITDYFATPAVPGPGGYATAGGCPGAPAPYATLGYKADFDRSCTLNTDDLSDYITAYFTGC